MDAQKVVMLGGRKFVATPEDDMTFDQFAWIQNAIEKAGLGQEMMKLVEPVILKASEEKQMLSDETAQDLTTQIVTRAYRGRAHLDVLAGMLVEEGKRWTYEGAEKVRDFLGEMKGRPDIETANVLLAQAILGFFWSGLASMKSFQNSSLMPEVVARLKAKGHSDLAEDLETSES